MNYKALTVVAILAWCTASIVKADIVHEYISIICEDNNRRATIYVEFSWSDEPPPPRSIRLEEIPRVGADKDVNAGLLLCQNGSLGKISIKGAKDEDHPGNDAVEIYLNGIRQFEHPISSNSMYGSYSDKVIFYKMPRKPFLILECIDGKGCRRSVLSERTQ